MNTKQTSVSNVFTGHLKSFNSTYSRFEAKIPEIPVENNLGQQLKAHLKTLLNYNILNGKNLRGSLTYSFTKACCAYLPDTFKLEDILDEVLVVSWCLEALQGLFLILDDIMDGSELRRNKPCWYKLENIGLMGINDAFMMECCLYNIIEMVLSKHPKLTEIICAFRQISFFTTQGQYYDMNLCSQAKKQNYANFIYENYLNTIKYKTTYYSFILPLKLAFLLSNADNKNNELFDTIHERLSEFGALFQIQDDFLDLYCDSQVTGKSSTDIIDGKCTWFAVQALQRCNAEQRKTFIENYASDQPTKIQAILNLYSHLDMKQSYESFIEVEFKNEGQKLNDPSPIESTPFKGLLLELLAFLQHRKH